MDASFTGSLASFGDIDEAEDPGLALVNDQHALQDQVLRSLMLNYGLLEDIEAGATLRDFRRSGPLRDVREDAQTTLLGSLLYEYSDAASPSRAAEARAASLHAGASLPTPAALADATTTEDFARLRSSLDRILGEAASVSGSVFGSTAGSQLLGETSTARSPLALGRTASVISTGSAEPGGPEGESPGLSSARSRTGGFLDTDLNLSLMEEEVLRMIRTSGSEPNLGETGVSAPPDVMRTHTSGFLASRSSDGFLGNTELFGSMGSSGGLHDGEDVLESSTDLLGNSLGASQSMDLGASAGEDVTGMLQRLVALDVATLDESLARSIRRVLQMGAVLAGARLADEEIRALPKVRFEQAEEQQCAICLESFKSGELLTELPCRHFFHVECVAKWFQRSTRCPLCRTGCAPNRDYDAIAAMAEADRAAAALRDE